MISPERLNKMIPARVENEMSKVEKEILVRIIRDLKYKKSKSDFERLLNKALKKYEKRVEKIAKDTVRQAVAESNNNDAEIMKEAKSQGKETTEPRKTKDFEKYIAPMSATLAEMLRRDIKKAKESARITYSDNIDKIKSLDLERAKDLASFQNVVKDISKNGIRVKDVVTKGKRSYELDNKARQQVTNVVNEATKKVSEDNFNRMNTNLVEVSAHPGARPSHQVWQGKRYWWKNPVPGYDEFVSSTGYGDMLGLKGINCYHDFQPVYEGMKSTTTKINKKRNNRIYELKQKQRGLERQIRKYKEKEEIFAEADMNKERKSIKRKRLNKQKELKKYINMHKSLKRQPSREEF